MLFDGGLNMDKSEFLEIFDTQYRRDLLEPNVRREAIPADDPRVVRHSSAQFKNGFISYFKLNENSVEQEIDEQVEFFSNLGYEFEWKVYDHDSPADIRDRLTRRGFVIEELAALMILDTDVTPAFLDPEDVSVRRVEDEAGIQAIMRMEKAVWNEDHSELAIRLWQDLQTDPMSLSVFASYEGEQLVSAAWIYYHPPTKFASLWGGSTLAEHRGKGHYTALLNARMREARSRGYRFLMVDASPMSRPILERRGFDFYGFSTACVWKPEKKEGSSNA